jgi:SPX domain protein involved in polyphosphate accumulation
MQPDRLQLQRFELKYIVSESMAVAARDFVRAYLNLDPFSHGKAQFSYPIHSLYLDSPDLKFYRQTANGEKNRYKLRVRYYDEDEAAPAFLEIKRRSDNAIFKQRCPIHKSAVSTVLAGAMPLPSMVLSGDPQHIRALERFVRFVVEDQLRPTGHVAYRREAWISAHDNSVRVTMDRDIRFDSNPTTDLTTNMAKPVRPFGNHAVLEIKFTGRFPAWFAEIVRACGLTRGSAAKYADGLLLFGEDNLRRSGYGTVTEKPLASSDAFFVAGPTRLKEVA